MAVYSLSFTNVLTLVIPGSVHGLSSMDLVYQLYTPAGGTFHVAPGTYDITLGFPVAQSGPWSWRWPV